MCLVYHDIGLSYDSEESASLSWKLGTSSAVMVALDYPGKIQNNLGARRFW